MKPDGSVLLETGGCFFVLFFNIAQLSWRTFKGVVFEESLTASNIQNQLAISGAPFVLD